MLKKIILWVLAVLAIAFVAIVIIRIPYVMEKKKTDEAVVKIHSTKLTLDDVMGKNLPPSPGAGADKTIAGIDANNNGIRDDVELAIFATYPDSAKTRAEVSGSGKKPWKQKGTGRARAGSIRSPLWRHGGVIFAKKPREFSYSMPKKKVHLALLSALSSKAKDGSIMVLDELKITTPKTKSVAEIIKNLKLKKKVLLISKRDKTLNMSSRNIANLFLHDVTDLTTYDVLNVEKILFTKESLDRCSILST